MKLLKRYHVAEGDSSVKASIPKTTGRERDELPRPSESDIPAQFPSGIGKSFLSGDDIGGPLQQESSMIDMMMRDVDLHSPSVDTNLMNSHINEESSQDEESVLHTSIRSATEKMVRPLKLIGGFPNAEDSSKKVRKKLTILGEWKISKR